MEATTARASKTGQSEDRIRTIKGKDRCRYRLLVRPAGDIAKNVGTEQWREGNELCKAAKILIVGQAPETFFNSTAESRKRYCQSCNRPPAGPNPVRGIYKTADLAHFPPVKDLSRLVHRAPQIITAKYRQGRQGQSSDINEVPRTIIHPHCTTDDDDDNDDDDTLPHQSNNSTHLFPIPPLDIRAHRESHHTLNHDNAVVAQTNDLTDSMSMTA
ncbi:hypothetical protein NEUTE2DRAFT_125483 [Neurospora tetrasperma FGSC 2509]|nr:hypothetical protein NEUTE2DRAFT_125483 [Neurospora tetrasperma FGSC 2509]